MVQENNTSINKDEYSSLSKQEIFRHIDQELLSRPSRSGTIIQKTRSNYRFIILIDIFALFCAILGVYIVYNTFKEQQIKLVSGQQGVKALGSTLLAEMNKQYLLDLDNKERELQETKNRLAQVEIEYSNQIAQIQLKAEQEIERRKQELAKELQAQLVGKDNNEILALQKEYEDRMQQMEEEVQRQKLNQERQEQQKLQEQRESAKQEEDVQQQIQSIRDKLEKAQEAVVQVKKQEKDSQLSFQAQRKIIEFDRDIASIFLDIRQNIKKENYEKVLDNISEIRLKYKSFSEQSEERKNADLYLVELLQEYLEITQNMMLLDQNAIEKKELIEFVDLISKSNIVAVDQKVKMYNKRFPELVDFSQYYYLHATKHQNMNTILNKADKLVQRKEYREAIDLYKTIIQHYSLNPKTSDIVQRLYKTVVLELKDQGVLNNEIPINIEDKVQNVLDSSNRQKIIYLRQPQGYVADIIDENTVLISLISTYRVRAKQKLEVYRIIDTYELKKIQEFSNAKSHKNTFEVIVNNHKMVLGDLVYIKE